MFETSALLLYSSILILLETVIKTCMMIGREGTRNM
jgi:hypothetical protein